MRSGGVVTGQNVSLAALLRTGVYEVCAVWGCGGAERGCGAAGRLCLLTEMVPFPFQRHCKAAEKGSFPGVFIFPV